jgi:uncharacterized protein with FMN-binding domain
MTPHSANRITAKTMSTAALALSIASVLAGCAESSDAGTGSTETGTSETESSESSAAESGSTESGSSSSGSSSSEYTDGTYDATGSYQSPDGTESIEVELTIVDGVVTDVAVTGNGDNPNSKRYQGEFIDAIDDEVVGKKLDDLDVDRVAGSSLTSGGFNEALDQIKAEAVA